MKVPVSAFLKYAGTNPDRWDQLVGREINHPTFGSGQVNYVLVEGSDISIYVEFASASESGRQRCFGTKGLVPVENIDLPTPLAEKIVGPAVPGFRRIRYGPVQTPLNPPVTTPLEASDTSHPEPKFSAGEEVCLKFDRTQRGRIIKARIFSAGEWNYEVYFSADDQRIIRETEIELWQPTIIWGSLNELLCDLALVKLRQPLGDALYALYSSRTLFEVYQFKPALKFLANPEQRMLIADEVGLGKTIEAGIIYLELQARLELDRVLIVCPSSLRQKWQDEMKARFDEEFVILDSQGARRFLDQLRLYGGAARLRGIISLELIRRKDLAEAFSDVRLDLLIIDEAHHCRNTDTLANAVASVLAENADAALLLTATPLQMGQADLFNLLNILSPGEFDNFDAFIDRLEPNQFINRAAQILSTGDSTAAAVELRKVETTNQKQRFLGSPYYQEVLRILDRPYPSQQKLITAQRRLIELNTLSSVFTRTRKRDIQEKIPIRTAQTLPVTFTPEEKHYYNQVIEEVREEFYQSHRTGMGSGFVTIMKERQVASCITAYMRRQDKVDPETYAEDLAFESDFVSEDEKFDADSDGEASPMAAFFNRSRRVHKLQPRTRSGWHDSKFDIFWTALKKVLDEDPQTKVLVFSFFRDTIDYLEEELSKRKVDVRAIHGGYKVLDRYQIIEQFRDNPQIRVLISSDVGSEGLDFQFCDTLFNYDLPWNPMKVEQRIGRIDRFGQVSDRVRIFNLVIEDSIESRILYRLYERIELFKRSIGDIEAILGEQIRELTQVVFSKHLSPQEEINRADQAAHNILMRKQEMDEFEQKKLQFLGQEAIFSTTVEKTIESGRYISDVEIKALVGTYIQAKFPLSRVEWNGPGDESFTLFANDDLVTEVKAFIFQKRKNDPSSQQFLQKLRPGQEIPMTFRSDLAFQRKLLEFITPRHPLAQAALEYWKGKSGGIKRAACIRLDTKTVPSGRYCFFIFTFRSAGIDKDTRIIPIVVSAENGDVYNDFSKQFLGLAQTCALPYDGGIACLDPSTLDQAEESALLYMTRERDVLCQEMKESNTALLNARRSAVEQSYQAKRKRIDTVRQKVNNQSIIRMYEGQLRNMEARYLAKIRDIQSKTEVQVSFSLELHGFAEVVRCL
ncbi:MAG: SNF2-related protein [Anaerolineaceae bacterium]|nr:SNF2-related protein [Anaerolineaceae bacterium]